MIGSITWFHKMMIALMILNVIIILYWNDRTKKKGHTIRLEAERKKWLNKETANLYRVSIITDENVTYHSEPLFPKCILSYSCEGLARLQKRTSLVEAQNLINNAMKNGYFTIGQATVPARLVQKAEVLYVERTN